MHLSRMISTTVGCVMLLLCLGVAPVSVVRAYAVGQSKYGRIEKFPYQVMLIGKQLWRKRILCGGTLMNRRWILTAGHCTMGVTHFDVYLGAKTVDDPEETGRIVVRSNKFIVHEGFNTVTAANDIALVKLPEDVRYTMRIQPAMLPHRFRTEHFVGTKVVATGWGAVAENSNSDPMQYTELRVISNDECAEEYDVITEGVICAKGLQDETVCSGDSGGPLVLKGTQIVVGITSFGPADGCETNIPGGFTRVTHYLDWIESKIGATTPAVVGVGVGVGVGVAAPAAAAMGAGRGDEAAMAMHRQTQHQYAMQQQNRMSAHYQQQQQQQQQQQHYHHYQTPLPAPAPASSLYMVDNEIFV